MTKDEIFEILNIDKSVSNEPIRICTDSRKIKKGDLFIALKGKNFNGNNYVKDAINKGAIYAIVDDDIDCDRCIKVNNTYEVLFKIGNYIRKKYNKPLIAITGSNGKTTTKELISFILCKKYNVLYNKESRNNIIGVSDTLFNIDDDIDIVVTELGSNHIGEIEQLSMMCEPNYSIITNIGSSHLQYFKNKKNIFKEKASITKGMKNGKLYINGDDKYLYKLDSYKCGIKDSNDLIAYNIECSYDKVSFNIKLNKEYKVIFNNPGKHFVVDILLAISVCLNFMDIKTIISRIKKFKLIDKRMSIIKSNNNIIINDCYNSSLESFKAGLDYLNSLNGTKIIIFGDILELGNHSKRIHKKIDKMINTNISVFKVGKYSKYIKGKQFISIEDMINYFKDNPIKDSIIYVKGSRRMQLDTIVDFLLKKV